MTTHGGRVTTTTQRQPYQGYPYVNPVVNDVPSIDPSSIYRKTYLRRQMDKKTAIYVDTPGTSTSEVSDRRKEATTNNNQTTTNNNQTTTNNNQTTTNKGTQKEARKDDGDDEVSPVIYVDIPESSTSEDGDRRNEATIEDDDLPPVIYIDLQSSNQMTESPATRSNEGTSSSIDDTIYFDQFEDRRITPKETARNSTGDSPSAARAAPHTRPGNLAISKETYVYGRLPTPDDGFSLTPIPISEFPEPPPAYSEVQERGPVTQQPTVSSVDNDVQNPPRTVIITNDSARSPSSQRKLLTCQHCGTRVHTMVLKQAGAATHALALSFLLFCLFPLTILVYTCSWFKYENHYCPSCSKLIGYEVPMLCQTLVYASTDLTRRVTS